MYHNIRIRNRAEVCTIDIEGTIGVPEAWQFDDPAERVATYEAFCDAVRRIGAVEAADVVVNIRSTGGDVNDALLIYEALASLPARITTRCYGYTASAATLVAQAASEGCREISANALYLIHNAVCATEGNAEELAARLDLLRQTDRRLAALYAARAGRPEAEFVALMAENNGSGRWLAPAEAVAAGLADRVIGGAAGEPDVQEASAVEARRAENGLVAGQGCAAVQRSGLRAGKRTAAGREADVRMRSEPETAESVLPAAGRESVSAEHPGVRSAAWPVAADREASGEACPERSSPKSGAVAAEPKRAGGDVSGARSTPAAAEGGPVADRESDVKGRSEIRSGERGSASDGTCVARKSSAPGAAPGRTGSGESGTPDCGRTPICSPAAENDPAGKREPAVRTSFLGGFLRRWRERLRRTDSGAGARAGLRGGSPDDPGAGLCVDRRGGFRAGSAADVSVAIGSADRSADAPQARTSAGLPDPGEDRDILHFDDDAVLRTARSLVAAREGQKGVGPTRVAPREDPSVRETFRTPNERAYACDAKRFAKF